MGASKGDVVALDDVWDRYIQFANEYNTISSSSYKDKHTFGICLKSKVKDFYQFFNKLSYNETIMFPINYLKEGISSIIHQNENELQEQMIPKYCPENENEFLSLVHVALRLRGQLLEKTGYHGISVTEDAAIKCIPEDLYLFLCLLFGGQDLLEGEYEHFESGKWTQNVIMSIAQDIIFGLSKGRKWTPKHIGLTSTLHQKTRSKELVNLFYHAGHCLSYDSLLKID